MDIPPLEELTKTFQSVVDLTLCAICLETVSKDMVQCVNGHLLCAACKVSSNLKKCPTCQAEFSGRTPSGFIVQLLEALPPRCKHKNCGVYVSKTVDDGHEKYCDLRPTSCKLERCVWTGPGKGVIPHLRDAHPNQRLYTCCHKVVLENFDLNKSQTRFDSFMVWNQYLWQEITYEVDKKALINYFHFVPLGKPKGNFFVELDASSDEMKCKFQVKLNPDPDVPKQDAPFILIPQFMLPFFVDKEKKLSFDVLLTMKGSLSEDKNKP